MANYRPNIGAPRNAAERYTGPDGSPKLGYSELGPAALWWIFCK